MKQSLTTSLHSSRLLLFFAGWGMDETPFLHYCSQEADLMICYDYRRLDFDSNALADYAEVQLVAWSMGIWAASQVLQHHTLPITRSIAINGTLYPVDADRGIPPAIFQGTLEGLCEASLRKFQRRMCGDGEAYKQFQSFAPRRPWEELKEELAAIGEQYRELPPSTFTWDRAFIGNNDRIFPPPAQQKAWEDIGIAVEHGSWAHYDNDLLQHLCQPRVK